jgi:hypothetical protein
LVTINLCLHVVYVPEYDLLKITTETLIAKCCWLPAPKEKTNFSWIKFPRPLETGKLHVVVVAASVSFLLAFD